MDSTNEINTLMLQWEQKHGKAIAESRVRMTELMANWEFLDGTGAITVPMTDEEIAATWDADVIRNLQGIEAGEHLVDLRRCPVSVDGWRSYAKAMVWLQTECARTSLRPWTKEITREVAVNMKKQGSVRPDVVFMENVSNQWP
jgi:hypothetical protein